ncbi:TULIP family P47-like protein [Polymorphospora rubra]|uniref:TULIP family P47-like protein n=1 Tax=Polymorphospora rubra TaxID=338584 RepID=UPI0033E9CA7B
MTITTTPAVRSARRIADIDPNAAKLARKYRLLEPRQETPELFQRRDVHPPRLQEVLIDNWDTCYAIRLSDANRVIEREAKWPATFQQVINEKKNYGLHGDFGVWQMSRGGSGEIVYLKVRITSGVVTYYTDDFSLDDATAYVAVKLRYLPQGSARAAENPAVSTDNLRVNTLSSTDDDPPASVRSLVLSWDPDEDEMALMLGALNQWFNNHLEAFTHVFASVDLNAKAADDQFQWLSPTSHGYAYQNGTDDESSYFGVLCMTQNNPDTNLNWSLPSGAIPAGSRAGFTISLARFLSNVVKPGLPKSFEDATDSSFRLNDSQNVIENVGKLKMKAVRVGAIDYTPYVNSFVLQVVGEEIQIRTLAKVDISPGIRAVIDTTTYQKLIVVDKPDGTQTLDYEQSRDPYVFHTIETDIGIEIMQWIIVLAAAVASAVAGEVIEKVSQKIAACIVIAIVAGLIELTIKLIEDVIGGKAAESLPPLDLLAQNATAPITWPRTSGFQLDQARLIGSFQLGGEYAIK